jgi:hypothetical protein
LSTFNEAICGVRSMLRMIAAIAVKAGNIAILLGLLTAGGSLAHAGSPPQGPAGQEIKQWFTSDRSLGCFDRKGEQAQCTLADHNANFFVFYGDGSAGKLQNDALAFVYYLGDPTGNAENLQVAYFRRFGDRFQFVKKIPNVYGQVTAKTVVVFSSGMATFSLRTLKPTDSLCCPTGQTKYSVRIQ